MNKPRWPDRLEQVLATWPKWQCGLSSPPTVEKELKGGLSNKSWLISTDLGWAVVRLNSPMDSLFNIDRYREQTILAALSSTPFCPDVWYCSPEYGYLVYEFIDGKTLSDTALNVSDFKDQITKLLAMIQQVTLTLPRFDYWQHLCHYRRQLIDLNLCLPKKLENSFKAYQDELQSFQLAPWAPVLVHHDLTAENIIVMDDRLVVIDWEYAAMGYAGMDNSLWMNSKDPFAPVIDAYRELINGFWYLLSTAN